MKILVDIPRHTFSRMEKLLSEGRYASVSNFIVAAVENQLLLERIDSGSSIGLVADVMDRESETQDSSCMKRLALPVNASVEVSCVPEESRLIPAETSPDAAKYLWGQINRIFPVKVGLRVLVHLLTERDGKSVNLEEYNKVVISIAQNLRSFLVARTGKITGGKESLWAGLPKSNLEKSVARFKAHFIGYTRSDGLIEGALGKLKFANIYRDTGSEQRIAITDPGLRFCILRNPILDDQTFTEGSLGAEERRYYLSHVSSCVPYEKQAFIDVLLLIKAGTARPSSLTAGLKKKWGVDWSLEHVNTQRSGIVSRLHELALVERKKIGVEVEYKLTENGLKFATEG